MDRAEVGRRGEAVAARFYQKQGCLLVAHNYSQLVGEIDLILREPDGTLVFCEVKTRAKDSLDCLLYTSPSPRDRQKSRMPSSA